MTNLPREITDYFRRIGRKGGSRTSQRKREAARRNILLRWERVRAKSEKIVPANPDTAPDTDTN